MKDVLVQLLALDLERLREDMRSWLDEKRLLADYRKGKLVIVHFKL